MRRQSIDPQTLELGERVVEHAVNRTAKVMRGGKRFSFSAVVVAGNGHGVVGFGYGKGADVPTAVEKARRNARKRLVRVMLLGETIPHTVIGRFGASRILLRPAAPGTGVIAASAVRAILEMAGVKDILTKSLGSNTTLNLIKATMDGLSSLVTKEEAARRRGIKIE